MATSAIKFDDGTGGFATNCFPVKSLGPRNDEVAGAWLVAQKAEQRRRFKAFLCSKPRTYDEIHDERKKADKTNTAIIPPYQPLEVDEETKTLDGFFLMKQCCVEDPTDLCSVNINAQGLSEVKEEDLQLFDNVAYVNASENILPLRPFTSLPVIRELELSLNGLRGLNIQPHDFQHLEMLDLSYNNLSPEDVLSLGLIPQLKVLHLTGNSLRSLPPDMARPHLVMETFEKIARFRSLEILMLDDNKFSDQVIFAALAGLRKLKHLNLSKNQIKSVPQLLLVEGKHISHEPDTRRKHGRRSRPSSRRSNRSRASLTNTPEPGEVASGEGVQGTASNTDVTVTKSTSQTEHVTSSENVTVPTEMSVPSMGDLGTLSEMKLDELDLEDVTKKVVDSMPPSKSTTKITDMDGDAFQRDGDGDMPLPPPFPELAHLNLAYNKISEEEGLLPVAAWPMLSELVIHHNPLTTQNSGDPPILKRFLKDRLGIAIQRKQDEEPPKPHIEVPVKPDRKVVTRILPVPRCNVDELLALEAPKVPSIQSTPKHTPHATPQPPGRDDTGPLLDNSTPLPPINTNPREDNDPPEGGADKNKGPAFFMTQVDDPTEEKPRSSSQFSYRSEPVQSPSSETSQSQKGKKNVGLRKYKGFEALLESEESSLGDEIPTPKDLPGNIRALQYALAHPLVFRENIADLQVPQPPFRPLHKTKAPASKPPKTKAEQMDSALHHLHSRSTVVEMDLKSVLNKKKQHKKNFPDAEHLLRGVQRRYNAVRVSSMKEARDLHRGQESLKDTIHDARKQLNHIAKTTA